MQKIMRVSLDRAARALRLCYFVNLPCAFWAESGAGKSDVVRQSVPKGWGFYDFRASDKEASDIGGIPYPESTKDKVKRVEYLMTRLLPFDTDEHCVVLFDEFDRTSDLSVQNAMLQVILDRSINGHRLSPNARIVICGNGTSDTGTLPLTTASARRMVHLYIETKDEAALEAWLTWAEGAEVAPELVSFAKYRSDVWCGNLQECDLIDYATPSNRTRVMASKLWAASKSPKITFETTDVILPLMAGCVGMAEAQAMLAWFKVVSSAPTVEEIVASPRSARLPSEHGVYYALGLALPREADKRKDDKVTDSLARYIARWPREQAKFAFERLMAADGRAATSAPYMEWEAQHR